MRTSIVILALVLGSVVAAAIAAPSLRAGGSAPAEAVGRWEGQGREIVSWSNKDYIVVDLDIRPDGTVTGIIGDAFLRDARIRPNRGSIGRRFDWWTDWIVEGRLEGAVVISEGIVREGVKIPFSLEGGRMRGSVHTSGWHIGGKKTMVFTANIDLEKATVAAP
jgi:hypothetical protein